MIIIGASGYIGRNLKEYFKEKGKQIFGTYYHSKQNGLNYFDLENPDLSRLNVDLEQVSHAIICSATSKIDECKKNEDKSYKINVKGTKKLIEQCFESNIKPIFLSLALPNHL